jgi:hypothetical protein
VPKCAIFKETGGAWMAVTCEYAKAARAEWAERGRQQLAGYSGPVRVRLGWLGCNLGDDSNEFDFFISRIFGV